MLLACVIPCFSTTPASRTQPVVMTQQVSRFIHSVHRSSAPGSRSQAPQGIVTTMRYAGTSSAGHRCRSSARTSRRCAPDRARERSAGAARCRPARRSSGDPIVLTLASPRGFWTRYYGVGLATQLFSRSVLLCARSERASATSCACGSTGHVGWPFTATDLRRRRRRVTCLVASRTGECPRGISSPN